MPSFGSSTLVFFVNGRKIEDADVDPSCTLLSYLRTKLRLCGAKLGCGEGGCGACTVMVSRYLRTEKRVEHFTVNSCLAPVASVHGQAVTTVEGIGSSRTKLHPVQERIALAHGTQCGFCTPGIVMSMYTLLRNHPQPTMKQIEDNFQGNLCRCTGYRPILQGYSTFTADGCCGGMANGCCKNSSNGESTEGLTNGCSKPCSNGYSNMDANNITVNQEDGLATGLFDQRDFVPYDPSQEAIFPAELKMSDVYDRQYLVFKGKDVTWYRPRSLEDMLDLKDRYPEAKVTVGNTEVGIDVKFKGCVFPVLIAPPLISEMNVVEVNEQGVTFGASVTLNTMAGAIRNIIQQEPEHKTRILSAVLEMLQWFAGKQIRNVASLGGNIMTASPISDLNPLLMAARAKLLVASQREAKRIIHMNDSFFTGYRKTDVKPWEILVSVTIPFTTPNQHFFGFKQAQRRDDDIAIVNAGMHVEFEENNNIVKDVVLAFGGMAPTTVLATGTMQALKGKHWEDQILHDACRLLEKDLPLEEGAPGGMVQYRRTLTTSFFFKFYYKVLQLLHRQTPGAALSSIPKLYKSVCSSFQKDVPKASQLYQIVAPGQTQDDPLGRPIPHQSAIYQATGEAVYCDDRPELEGELHLALVTSTRAHAKLLSLDPAPALALEGVVGFIDAGDLPGDRNMAGLLIPDEEVFATEKVLHLGQIMGAVVAENRALAQKAAKLVAVEYEDLEPIFTIEEAIAAEAFDHRFTVSVGQGDVDAGFSNADHILEGEVRVGGQDHFYLETQCASAVPSGEHNELEITVASQSLNTVQLTVAKALGLPANRVVAKVKRLGGGFGGKETRTTMYTVPVALAAHKLNRPVRYMMDRDEDMTIKGGRHPFLFKYKVGFLKSGKLTALKVMVYCNSGHVTDLSPVVLECAMVRLDSGYLLPALDATGYVCKTNLPTNTAYRGFGAPQSILFIEHVMSDIATYLKADPFKVREINMYKEGDKMYCNQELKHCTITRCWQQCAKQSDYVFRKKSVDQFNRENRYKKRGICILPMKYGIGFPIPHLNQGAALVHVYTDGTVLVTHGGVEMGQGLHTKLIQVASRTLRIPPSKVHVSETSTDRVPNAVQTAGSMGSDLFGQAVLNACKTLMERLEPVIVDNPKGKWEDWVNAAYLSRISLSATGFHRPDCARHDFANNTGDPFQYFSYGAACSEVEIDCLTGDHQVLRTDIVMDVGESLNPAVDIGQIEGAFVQGYGLYTLEELRYSPGGSLYTKGPGTYKIPSFGDIPSEFNVSLLKGSPNVHAVYSSKAIGEPPLLLAASVFYAIKAAILSARKDAGVEGEFRLDSPATPERIRMACIDQFTEQFQLAAQQNEKTSTKRKPWSIVV